MKNKFAHLAIAALTALGIVFGLAFAATNVSASNGSEQNKISSADMWGNCWYLVRYGDNLFRIGLRYNVSPYYLAHLNGLWNPNWIYAGMKLRVPCGGPPPPPPPPPPCEQPARYIVKPGDNLFRIALTFGTTVNALRDANNLWGQVLRPGMVLTIPCPMPHNGMEQTPAAPQDPTQAVKTPPVLVEQTPTTSPEQGPTPTTPTDQPPAQLPPEPSASIVLGAQAIDPNAATIQVGQSVLWTNNSQNTYTLVSGLPGQPSGDFNSGELPPGATFIHTFTAAGSYSYYVNENPTLIGQVLVNP